MCVKSRNLVALKIRASFESTEIRSMIDRPLAKSARGGSSDLANYALFLLLPTSPLVVGHAANAAAIVL